MLKVVAVCTTKKSKVPKTNTMEKKMKELTTWIETDFIYKNLILNGLTNELYDYYSRSIGRAAKEV